MKTIIKKITIAFFALVGITTGADVIIPPAPQQTNFGSSLEVFTRSFEAASYGEYRVRGDGLRNSDMLQYVYYKAPVTSTPKLASPFILNYTLDFVSYKTTVEETATIYDKSGKPLFVSFNQWQPTETVSSDGKNLKYTIPENNGYIRFYLADQKIATDAEFVTVQMNGNEFSLEVSDGFVTVPGWIYEQKGTFTTWKNGVATVTDIFTGLKVPGGTHTLMTGVKGVEGIDVIGSPGLVLTINPFSESNLIYETTVQAAGSLTVRASTYWGNVPTGLYYTIVGQGTSQQYVLPITKGEFKIPCLKGQTFQIKLVWPQYGGPKG